MTEENKTFVINPTTDFVFKRIFGTEDGKICLIQLLNAIFNGNQVVTSFKLSNAAPENQEVRVSNEYQPQKMISIVKLVDQRQTDFVSRQ